MMKTRVNVPYLYLLVDVNMILVYEMVAQNYVTVSTVLENDVWELFEIKDEGEFGGH